jgi:hypothetical protein
MEASAGSRFSGVGLLPGWIAQPQKDIDMILDGLRERVAEIFTPAT